MQIHLENPYREYRKDIYNMVDIVFDHKKNNINQVYLTNSLDDNTLGKTVLLKDNFVDIKISNKVIKDREKFLFTMFHELNHARFYHDIKNMDYLKLNLDDEKEFIKAHSFVFIDEYKAYKNSFENFKDIRESYSSCFYTLNSMMPIKENFHYLIKNTINEFDYINKLKIYMSISFAYIDSKYKTMYENYIIGTNTFIDNILKEIYDVNKSMKNVPTKEELQIISEDFRYIFNIFRKYRKNN